MHSNTILHVPQLRLIPTHFHHAPKYRDIVPHQHSGDPKEIQSKTAAARAKKKDLDIGLRPAKNAGDFGDAQIFGIPQPKRVELRFGQDAAGKIPKVLPFVLRG